MRDNGVAAGADVLDDVIAWRDGRIVALDQTALPHESRVLDITTVDQLVDAIVRLAVRGAPVLGVAGALGVALAVRQAEREGWDEQRRTAEVKRIADARPTAVNLRREVTATAAVIPRGAAAVEAAANAVRDTAIGVSKRMSERGAGWLVESRGIVPLKVYTHCNTGTLACLGWGSALGVVRALHNRGALAHVLVDETRPLLQGARLTCWELAQLGIEHYLACDGAAPFVISQGMADAVVVGADRVAANGDVANKIGTYSLALAARRAGIPFVVVVPESTIDDATPSGAEIPLEQRAAEEVTHFGGVRVAPDGTRALNYAFDVTPADLVTAIVTEDRLIFPAQNPLSRTARGDSPRSACRGLGHGRIAEFLEQVIDLRPQHGRYQVVRRVHRGVAIRGQRPRLAELAERCPVARAGEVEEGCYSFPGLSLCLDEILEPHPQACLRMCPLEGQQRAGVRDPVGGEGRDRAGGVGPGERGECGVGDAPGARVEHVADDAGPGTVQAQEPGFGIEVQERLGGRGVRGGYFAPASLAFPGQDRGDDGGHQCPRRGGGQRGRRPGGATAGVAPGDHGLLAEGEQPGT